MDTYKLGERVLASVSGTGLAREGVVTGVVTGNVINGSPQYMVRFDGDKEGHSGPCSILRRVT